MTKKNRIYLYIALFIGFAVLFNELRKISVTDLLRELNELKLSWLLVAVGCMLLHWAIEGKIIQGLLKRQQGNFSFKNAVRIPLIEHLFNAITPFSSGGQPAQLLALVKSGVDPGVSGSVCLMKFVVYQVMIVLNFVACIIFGFRLISHELQELSYFVMLGFLINVVVVVSLLMLMYCYPMTNAIVKFVMTIVKKFVRGPRGEALEVAVFEKMANFYEESQYMRREKSVMSRTFSLTFVQLICYYIVPYFILLSLGVSQVDVLQIVIFHAFIILIISLFPVPGGTGGAEYSFTLLFGSFIAVTSKLVVAIVLWRIVTHYIGILLGMVALFVKPDLPKAKILPAKSSVTELT
ncbi:lysylphosphatidylglycerol synthase transmembrane domain-containing protein [uncultured Vagococcus sp.]|uniref:lysylphosphatidylglycerol synthase transmembrane domain-containing protein n=1 Tax=uncultured Vagococcus sp. TaxID=189676 RepID=UPI0028D41FDE|nr:lysylphosphatidylglycerol synthase transmembrane domain-containing protein [uncultured Vagococcus sp.]